MRTFEDPKLNILEMSVEDIITTSPDVPKDESPSTEDEGM